LGASSLDLNTYNSFGKHFHESKSLVSKNHVEESKSLITEKHFQESKSLVNLRTHS
jgi:hypothetical protein